MISMSDNNETTSNIPTDNRTEGDQLKEILARTLSPVEQMLIAPTKKLISQDLTEWNYVETNKGYMDPSHIMMISNEPLSYFNSILKKAKIDSHKLDSKESAVGWYSLEYLSILIRKFINKGYNYGFFAMNSGGPLLLVTDPESEKPIYATLAPRDHISDDD